MTANDERFNDAEQRRQTEHWKREAEQAQSVIDTYSVIATQAREGIKTTREQAEAAYAKAQSRPNSSRIESSPVAPKRVELSRDADGDKLRGRATRDAGREGNGNGSVPWQSGGTRHSKATAEGSGVVRPDGRRPVVADSEGRLDHAGGRRFYGVEHD